MLIMKLHVPQSKHIINNVYLKYGVLSKNNDNDRSKNKLPSKGIGEYVFFLLRRKLFIKTSKLYKEISKPKQPNKKIKNIECISVI